jgi:hypothetical protein
MIPSDLPIREFGYIDREKIEDFVSALAGGLPVGRKETHTETGPRVDAALDAKVAKAGRKGRQAQLSWEEIRAATPALLFQELYQRLRMADVLTRLEQFQPEDWYSLAVGDFVEATCTVELSALEALLDLVGTVGKLMHLVAPSESEDPRFRQMMSYFAALDSERDSYNVRITPVGAPTQRHMFVTSLNKSNMRSSKNDLCGQHIVLGRVQRELKRGESFELFSLMPRGFNLSTTQIRDLLSRFKTMPSELGRPPTIQDLRVSYPAIVLTPVAIFR